MPEMFLSPLCCGHPFSIHPWRIVPDMLLMPALQLRNPILQLIQMEADNLPPNPNVLFFHYFSISLSAVSCT